MNGDFALVHFWVPLGLVWMPLGSFNAYTRIFSLWGHPSTWHCTFSKTVTKSALIDQPNTTTLTQTIYQLTGSKMFQIQNWKITVLNGAKLKP